ncbi:MAG: glycosyltransferase [Candidatus Aminicenantes bacterium]|nr:glycosyltransferase [Candidatus Aminicenantes bacterium]NIM81022.1 glycosyltransferase [Candidatus Aminicenantes bacterium]NIN20401.1 glycosyltransferase [Candidatus Aminicenantes bacterium]NIN44174.1 glycosyltransferase [Candidatus Aminicenantes bacterium]NIN86992.1 glycosyltransferase [Candidatus Aminicenantes bacterium]
MKIVYVTPGSGGTFYCQNCFRDSELLKSLFVLGHEVIKAPMYLPVNLDDNGNIAGTPVFFGAVNVYLKEKFPFYRHAPVWLERLFDSQALLQLAAKKSGSTRPTGLEEMTISMLLGEKGHQASELDHLINYLRRVNPDIVHLSNALLLGLAHRLKTDLGTGVVCSLQDENEWIDLMDESYQRKIWNIMAERAGDVDLFVTASRYYSNKSQKQLKIPADKIKVICGGINLDGYEMSSLPFDPPVIGYLCRMSEYFGLGILVDAFIQLKKDNRFKDLKLHITGGYTGEDKHFVKELLKKVSKLGYEKDVKIFKHFDKENRIKFLKSLTLLSVPVPGGEAFGAYQVEALAAGVPVVQPNVGCFPEFVEATGGGVIYEPNDGETLAGTIASLLLSPDRIRELSEQGSGVVLERFSMKNMAGNIVKVYEQVLNK